MKRSRANPVICMMILAAAISLTADLRSAEIGGIYFNDEYTAGNRKLFIRGRAILNYMLVIKAYAGALYMESGTPSSAALGEFPRILELHYFHDISAGDFRESTLEMMRRNTTEAEFAAISERIVAFNRLYLSVKAGDRYRAEYIPGRGTTLYLNARELGTVTGSDFSRAFFSIWIGRDPIDKKFRDRLLGKYQ
jgi:hypothetical protein